MVCKTTVPLAGAEGLGQAVRACKGVVRWKCPRACQEVSRSQLALPPSGMLARRLLLLALATTASALRLHRVSSRGASQLARRETLALGLASGLAVSVQPASADAPPTAAAPPTRSIRESIEALRAAPPSDSGQPLPSRSLVTRRYFTRETADVEYPSWFQGSWKCTSTLEQARPDPLPPRSPSTLTLTLSLTLTSTPTCRCSRPAEPRSSPRAVTAPRRCMPQGGSNPGPAASSQPHLFPPTPLSLTRRVPHLASPHLTSPHLTSPRLTSPLTSPRRTSLGGALASRSASPSCTPRAGARALRARAAGSSTAPSTRRPSPRLPWARRPCRTARPAAQTRSSPSPSCRP